MSSKTETERGRGHGPIREATIEVYDDVLEADQCENCGLKVPVDQESPDGFETHSCDWIRRNAAPKLRTDEDRNEVTT